MSTPQDEMNHVCQAATEIAFEQIAENGEFSPFAVVIGKTGELRLIALGEDQAEDGGEADLEQLRGILRQEAATGEFAASALASDVLVQMVDTGEETDAVRIEIEHAGADPVTCFVPYRVQDEALEQHIEAYLEPGQRSIFS